VDVRIRDARPDDADAIARILNQVIAARVYTVFDTPFTVEQERRFIEAFPSRGVFLVAESTDDRRVIGFQNVEPFAAFTHALDHVGVIGTFIDLERRRQGIGRRLFQSTFDATIRKGYEKLLAYIRADNAAALATYAAQGFRVIGTARAQAKIGGTYIDEVFVEKMLQSG
jgi:L-amino acid N-acyltransferase YncA